MADNDNLSDTSASSPSPSEVDIDHVVPSPTHPPEFGSPASQVLQKTTQRLAKGKDTLFQRLNFFNKTVKDNSSVGVTVSRSVLLRDQLSNLCESTGLLDALYNRAYKHNQNDLMAKINSSSSPITNPFTSLAL